MSACRRLRRRGAAAARPARGGRGHGPPLGEHGARPARWSVDFWVGDADATAALAAELGGSVVVEPHDAPPFRQAVLADPDGATFSISRARDAALIGYRLAAAPYTSRTPCVYNTCMARIRTNIELDVASVATIMDRYGVRTKTEAVDLALRHLAGQPMSREEALAMRGIRALKEAPADVPPRSGA